MLQFGTVEPRTLDLLRRLMAIEELSNFYLVGGTALALYFGHRKSIDNDLFATKEFQPSDLVPVLEKHFPNFSYRNVNNPIGLFAFIDEIKVDFVKRHCFPIIDSPPFRLKI